jgi:hypothetical protein
MLESQVPKLDSLHIRIAAARRPQYLDFSPVRLDPETTVSQQQLKMAESIRDREPVWRHIKPDRSRAPTA